MTGVHELKTTADLIKASILEGLENSIKSGELPAIVTNDASVERPQNPEHGNFASSLPMKLARQIKMPPTDIARIISNHMTPTDLIRNTQIAPPGFINIFLNKSWLLGQVREIQKNKDHFFEDKKTGKGKIQVEYVSANPTGRLHIAHARGAVVGSTIAKLLRFSGYEVEEEYYLNDAGSQIDNFNSSLLKRYKQEFGIDDPIIDNEYPGEDLIAIAKQIKSMHGDRFLNLATDKALIEIGKLGNIFIIEGITQDVKSLRITFDNWFSEKSLIETGQLKNCMDELKDRGLVEHKDGATWLLSTKLGEEKDNVLVRSTGSPSYFATDIAYHHNKFTKRNFDRVIDVWGADHQGQVPRLKSALSALGSYPENLDMVLVQMVRFKKGETSEKLSKRKGNIIPLIDLVEEIGADACRFMFLSRSHDSQLDFDLELAKKASAENPVYYVQYAHARICSLIDLAAQKNIDFSNASLNTIEHKSELDLLNKMLELPEVVETAVTNLEPHHLPYYSIDLANYFHNFYQNCRVISENDEHADVTIDRLALVSAVRVVLKKCLDLMGMQSPEKM